MDTPEDRTAEEGIAAVAAGYSPEMTARYRDEVQELLYSLFDDFLQRQEPRLYDVLQSARALDAHEGALLVKALQSVGIRFQLTAIAEEIAETRKVRLAEGAAGPGAVIGSFDRVLGQAAARGVDADTVSRAVGDLRVVPTLTPHPTEAKRVTILENHRRLYRTLVELETDRWTPREREKLADRLRDTIALLWMTGELRLERPTVDEEVSWGLHFFNETLIGVAGEVGDRLGDALAAHYPGIAADAPGFLRFASWIGGDRDGNPDVTAAVTRRTLYRHRENALTRHIADLERLGRMLSISEYVAPPGQAFRQRLTAALDAGGDGEAAVARNPHEPFRQFCAAVSMRLRATLGTGDGRALPYAGPEDFVADLRALEEALREIGAEGIAGGEVAALRHRAGCIGFRTAALDIRQDAGVVNRTVAALGGARERLAADLAQGASADCDRADLDAEAAETIALFRLLGEARSDPEAVGAFVLAGTGSAEDVLAVAWLAAMTGAGKGFPAIVPLFETVADLRAAPAILDALLNDAAGRAALTGADGAVEAMVGYAAANKDGGPLASVWEAWKAQRAIMETCDRHGVPVRFFHGRGGSISRGSASTGRAIAAQPADTLRGRLRVTEQGEVVSAKYSNRGTARTHLELLGAGVLAHGLAGDGRGPKSEGALEEMAGAGGSAYRDLLATPGFETYLHHATPVDELALLKAGSQASKRFKTGGVDELRAIPWVFAWSQSRHLLTGWYGVGTALEAASAAGGVAELRAMFGSERVFKMVLDEVEKALLQADMRIAGRYAELVPDEAAREAVLGMVREEHDRTVSHLLAVTEQETLGARFPSFSRRVAGARPLLDRSNAWQVDLLRRHRAAPEQESFRAQLLLSMHCVATGLGWTG